MNYKVTIETTDKDFVKGLNDIVDEYARNEKGNYDFNYISRAYENMDYEERDYCERCEDEFDNFTFGDALNIIIRKPNFGMRLPYWDEDEVVRVQNPDTHSKMSYPYLYMETSCENFPYIPCYEDIFSDDWEIVEMED